MPKRWSKSSASVLKTVKWQHLVKCLRMVYLFFAITIKLPFEHKLKLSETSNNSLTLRKEKNEREQQTNKHRI